MKPFKKRIARIPLICSFLTLTSLLSTGFVANEKYFLDTKETVITWKCAMQFAPQNKHSGYVSISKGELTMEQGRLASGTVQVDMKTIVDERGRSDNDLIDHLKSPDFFDVEKFPGSTFVITKVGPAKGKSVDVTGDLTIKGITHEVTFPLKMEVNDGTVIASGTLVIDRSKWDVRYGSGKFFANLADETISDNIELDVKIVARKK